MLKNYCVIMAGGVGSRFWPKSTRHNPKQFLDILGTGRTLIQQTYDRYLKIIPKEQILVVTNVSYRHLVKEQLPDLPDENILAEPAMKNTAPCLAYAAYKIARVTSEANLIVAPADHLILKEAAFLKIVQKAFSYVSTANHLVTIGIKPTRPDTGYGYIEYEENTGEPTKVIQFREKPDKATATSFISNGNFSWNSGMFVWSLGAILSSFETFLPELNELFKSRMNFLNGLDEDAKVEEIYTKCESISIDYGIMEKADNVYVYNADIGWSDLGTWGSVHLHHEGDSLNNVVTSGSALFEASSGNMVSLTKNKKLVSKGVQDMIIVETDNILLLIRKELEQDIKPLRLKAGEHFGEDVL